MHLFLLINLVLQLLQIHPDSPRIGDTLPPLALSGNMNTDSLRGHILVVDVWASWNAPSRRHNLQLIKLYEKYRQINFRRDRQVIFLSISLDTQQDMWLIARAKDDLHWPYNFCDFKGWESPLVPALNLKRVPSNFLVNEQGIIIARDIWGTPLDSTLKSLHPKMPN